MAAAAGPPPEAPEDEAPFVNVPARSRAEREAERDKDALEKQRLLVRTASRPPRLAAPPRPAPRPGPRRPFRAASRLGKSRWSFGGRAGDGGLTPRADATALVQERRGGHYRYAGSQNPILPPENSLSYQSESERFVVDVAGEEYDQRMANIARKEAIFARKRLDRYEKEEARWAAIEQDEEMQRERQKLLQQHGDKYKKNQSSVNFDPITLKYHNTKAGHELKYNDDVIKYRAAVRANHLYSKGTHSEHNIITGELNKQLRQPTKPGMQDR